MKRKKLLLPWFQVSTNVERHWSPEHISDVKLSVHQDGHNGGTLSIKLQRQTKDCWNCCFSIEEHHALSEGLVSSSCELDQEIDHVDVVSFRLQPVDIIETCESHFVAKQVD